MTILKTTLMTTALFFGTATTTFAQDAMMDKAKDMAVDKGTEMAKDKVQQSVGDKASGLTDPAAKIGTNMLKGDSAKDAVMNMGASDVKSVGKGAIEGIAVGGTGPDGMMDSSLSTDEALTAGKVMMKGGSKEDAAMAVAKDRAKDKMMNKVEGMMTKEVGGGTVVATDSTGAVPPVQATGTTTTTPAAMTLSDPNEYTLGVTAPQAISVNCPTGTTAQPDGSCMITGDYKE